MSPKQKNGRCIMWLLVDWFQMMTREPVTECLSSTYRNEICCKRWIYIWLRYDIVVHFLIIIKWSWHFSVIITPCHMKNQFQFVNFYLNWHCLRQSRMTDRITLHMHSQQGELKVSYSQSNGLVRLHCVREYSLSVTINQQ